MAATYDLFAGTCIRFINAYSVTLIPPPNPDTRVLDNACGTGLLTDELLKRYPDVHVNAVDIAPGMLDKLKGLIEEKGWDRRQRQAEGKPGGVETAIMDGNDLKFEDDTFDLSFTMFGVFFFPDKGPGEMYRTLKKGGTAVVTSWQSLGWLPIMHEVQKIVKPGEEPLSMGLLEKWYRKETLEETLRGAGFRDVRVVRRESLALAKDVEDMVSLLMIVLMPFREAGWGEEEKERMPGAIRRLLETKRKELFVETEDGSVGISMVAWVGIATK